MNAIEKARSAYARTEPLLGTERDLEYEAFARATRQLRAAVAGGRAAFPALVQGLHDNRRLWTVLATDVASQGNALPPALRAQIFYLAEFVRVKSDRVLDGSAEVEALIEINMAVMAGLRQRGAGC